MVFDALCSLTDPWCAGELTVRSAGAV